MEYPFQKMLQYLTLSPVSSAPLAMTGWLQTIGLQVGRTSAVSSEYHVPYLQEIGDSNDIFYKYI